MLCLNIFVARTVCNIEDVIEGVKALHGFCNRTNERKGMCRTKIYFADFKVIFIMLK